MSRISRQNLRNIKDIFEEKTGVGLRHVSPRPSVGKLVILAAAVVFCLVFAAFTYPLFTPLDGDELTLSASYEGDGIIQIYVENGSDKNLTFQKQAKLFSWIPQEEITRMDGEIQFENTEFPAHSNGVMTVDISKAYDIASLEREGKNPMSYYLLLTNRDFLFGHDWMCSFTFSVKQEASDGTQPGMAAEEMAGVEEALQFYFADSYQDQPLAWNEANFDYLQKVEEMKKRQEGDMVSPLSPVIMVAGPSTVLDPQPRIRTEGIADYEWTTADAYYRLVGGAAQEKALAVMANIPSAQYPDAASSVPILYTFVYETASVRGENCTFVYGRFLRFAELEAYKRYEDAHYTIYDMTDYFYTDLDAYLDDLQQIRSDLKIDRQVREDIRSLYENYREDLGSRIYYQEQE